MKLKIMPINELADIMSNDFVISIVKEYGPVNQSIVLMEELNELITESVKAMQLANNKAQLVEEISHCMISFCTYGYAYNLNWDVNKIPKIPAFSSTDFLLMLADVQKEISKKMRGKNNDDVLCEKMGICFGELQKCMDFYGISWKMVKEEVAKKVSKYSSKEASHSKEANHSPVSAYIGSVFYRIDVDPVMTGNGKHYKIKEFEITSIEKYWDGDLVLKSANEEICCTRHVDTEEPFLDYYITFSSQEKAEDYIERIRGREDTQNER